MKKKFFIYIFLFLLIISTSVFAVNASQIEDSSNDDNFAVLDGLDGNLFKSSDTFEMSPNSNIKGDLFLISNIATLKSDVLYSESISKDSEYTIDKINSYSTINGNAFICCNEFTLESGCEIDGDLYIVAKKINIQKSSIIHGNLFAVCENLVLNGKIENSVYATSKSFSMNYYGSIYKDLVLSSESVVLNSVIRRNIDISAEEIITNNDFLVYGNLTVDCNSFDFSGEIDGNAKINSKLLNFITSQDNVSINCLIKGNLDYSSVEELNLNNDVVNGEIIYSTYSEKEQTSFNFKSFIFNLLTFVAYIFVVAWLFTLLNKNYLSKNYNITVKNIFIALGIGLLAFLIVAILSILLIIINIGSTLAFCLIFAYIFLLFLAMPLFVLDIANLLKGKMNLYLGILAIALVLFLVSEIPYLGWIIMFLFMNIGSGRIIKHLLSKK